tara:strand:+ start:421 stop:741 length:321 start_codon:yes stop_codon:yes gene_type:complete
MYDHNDKKYIRVIIDDEFYKIVMRKQSFSEHFVRGKNVDNPLYGNILTVKVPFRYNRVSCKFEGAPVQSLQQGNFVDIDVDYMGVWNTGDYSGYTWKLKYIKLIDN